MKTRAWRILTLSLLLCSGTTFFLMANPFLGNPSGRTTIVSSTPSPFLLEQQGTLRQKIGDLFVALQKNPSSYHLVGILSIAFLYGIVHSLGPGHRKGIVFSLYLARKAPIWEPAATGIIVSLLHGGTSILILFLLKSASGLVSGITSSWTFYLETVTYGLLLAITLVLVLHTLHHLIKGEHPPPTETLNVGTLIATGFYPCPGTILILLLSLSLNQLLIGIGAVLTMSIGMSLPVIGFAYLGWLGREGILRKLKYKSDSIGKISAYIQLIGYSLLLLFTLYMAYPYFSAIL